jgi:hypothetical protein
LVEALRQVVPVKEPKRATSWGSLKSLKPSTKLQGPDRHTVYNTIDVGIDTKLFFKPLILACCLLYIVAAKERMITGLDRYTGLWPQRKDPSGLLPITLTGPTHNILSI